MFDDDRSDCIGFDFQINSLISEINELIQKRRKLYRKPKPSHIVYISHRHKLKRKSLEKTIVPEMITQYEDQRIYCGLLMLN